MESTDAMGCMWSEAMRIDLHPTSCGENQVALRSFEGGEWLDAGEFLLEAQCRGFASGMPQRGDAFEGQCEKELPEAAKVVLEADFQSMSSI